MNKNEAPDVSPHIGRRSALEGAGRPDWLPVKRVSPLPEARIKNAPTLLVRPGFTVSLFYSGLQVHIDLLSCFFQNRGKLRGFARWGTDPVWFHMDRSVTVSMPCGTGYVKKFF
jgi:hypothetical protein